MTIVESPRPVTGGVDTHLDTHVAAALDANGGVLGVESFATTPDGYACLLAWLTGFGPIARIGVEGTGAYGAGLARHLWAAGLEVIEVDRPNRQQRRRHGKSDPLDAVEAARAALSGRAAAVAKTRTGTVEAIRTLAVAKRSARQARIATLNQIRHLCFTAPDDLRERYAHLRVGDLVDQLAALRPRPSGDPVAYATRRSLVLLARRVHDLDDELADLDELLEPLIVATAPRLLDVHGVGVDTAAILLAAVGDNPERLRSEAAWAHLCGVAPIPASSGKTIRYRLNPSGNRQANHALWRIVITRMSNDPRTRAYVQRRLNDGKTKPEVIRILKRYVAREIYRQLRG